MRVALREEWRGVVGHPGYEVSNFGRVRSLDRVKEYERRDHYSGAIIRVRRRHKGKVLAPGTVKSGHQLVVLHGESVCVHVLALEAFVGPCPLGMECCHWDDDPANNRIDNLRWGTRADNLADYVRNRGHHQNRRHVQ